MMFLRLLCLVAGVLVLVVPPAILYPAGGVAPNAGTAAAALIVLVLASSGFFFIGMAGHRLRRSAPLRTLAALLLSVPVLASLMALWREDAPAMLWMASVVLGLSLVLYVTLVYRVVRTPGRRPLRRRARREPQLTLPPA